MIRMLQILRKQKALAIPETRKSYSFKMWKIMLLEFNKKLEVTLHENLIYELMTTKYAQ